MIISTTPTLTHSWVELRSRARRSLGYCSVCGLMADEVSLALGTTPSPCPGLKSKDTEETP